MPLNKTQTQTHRLHRLSTYFGHGTEYSTMVWPGTNYNNTIAWYGTKCDTIFLCRLQSVTQSFGYGTKCNNILARRQCNNNVITTNNFAKCNTIVHDNICSTKCIINDWSYPGDDAKCVSR